MKLLFDSPWYIILICITLSLGFSLFLYYRNRKNSEAPRKILTVLGLLRFCSTLLILLLLAGILLKQLVHETEYPRVIIALDNSASMLAGPDSSFVRNVLPDKLQEIVSAVKEKYEVHKFWFGSDVQTATSTADFTDRETDIDQLLKRVENDYANQNIGALVVFSDGIYNRGSNPVYSAEKLGFPVHTVAFGDTAEKTDVLIKKIDHNQIAYLGNNFPVQVQLAAKKMQGRKITLELWQGNVLKGSKEITASNNNFSEAVTFTLNASSAGIQKYKVKAGTNISEHNRQNNQRDFVVEVINNREKILLMAAAPHPDIAAIRETVLNHSSYELDFSLSQDNRQLQAYNLVIMHGYSPAMGTVLTECRNKKIPFFIINPGQTADLPGVNISGAMNRYNDAEPFIDQTFGYFTVSDELKRFMEDLPAVKTSFGNYHLAAGASALINQRLGSVETELPMLYFNSADDLKYGVFLGDGLWRWKLRDFLAHGNNTLFAELVSKCIQYLAVKSDKSFFRIKAPKIVRENETIELDAELYNKSYEPVNDPDVQIKFSSHDRKTFDYVFSKTSSGYHLSAGTLPPGEYSFSAKVIYNNETFIKEGNLLVEAVTAESINTVANHQLLFQLSAQSGGRMFSAGRLDELKALLQNDETMKEIVYSQALTSPLIDNKILFVIILLLFGAEWFLRKRYLLI